MAMKDPMRTAREYPTIGSQRVPVAMFCRCIGNSLSLQSLRDLAAVASPQGVNRVSYPKISLPAAQMLADLQEAANVAAKDCLDSCVENVVGLPRSEALGHIWLRQVIAAGGSAANFGFLHRHQLQPGNHF